MFYRLSPRQVSSYGGYLRYRLHTQTMRGDVLSLPAEASRPDIILKVKHTNFSVTVFHVQTNTDTVCKRTNPGICQTSSHTLFLVLLQGNQMTLVFMEREYSSPEEPHLGIVHMVEVRSPSQTFLCTAQPAKTRSNVMLPLLRLLTGKLPARSDR